MVYEAYLTDEQVTEFMEDYNESSLSLASKLMITPDNDVFNVQIIIKRCFKTILEASLKDGLLSRFGTAFKQ